MCVSFVETSFDRSMVFTDRDLYHMFAKVAATMPFCAARGCFSPKT